MAVSRPSPEEAPVTNTVRPCISKGFTMPMQFSRRSFVQFAMMRMPKFMQAFISAIEYYLPENTVSTEDIAFVLLCTQSPDYFLPTTACLIQDRLGIPTTAGALDFNLVCSGFIYGLGLGQGLIAR